MNSNMDTMRFLVFLSLLLYTSCHITNKEYHSFVTQLGTDTLAVESFKIHGTEFYADVVVRSPKTTLTRYKAKLNAHGGITSFKEYRFNPEKGFEGNGSFVRSIETTGDSLEITFLRNDETKTIKMGQQTKLLPFIEYTHWPVELALLQLQNKDSVRIPMLAGSRIRNFLLTKIDEYSRSFRHPFRGVMDITINDAGELESLDAGKTTRKLTVQRTVGEDIEKLALQFIKAEQKGDGFGALSGAVEKEYNINGLTIRLEYGSPSKRGRDLFGGIVPYGERWRTGANRATHIRFDKNILLEGLEVKAGEYTLFSIPEEDGGTLIINTQTGQNGRNYNQEYDLGRIALQKEALSTSVEDFTITVTESEQGVRLNLAWGYTQYYCTIKF